MKGGGRSGAPALDRPVFRSGLVTIVGRTNVGKSTLLNRLVGRKVAIMSEKPQTTRNRIVGVVNREAAQIVFIDTPGIHRPRHRLGEYMVGAALGALQRWRPSSSWSRLPKPRDRATVSWPSAWRS